MSFSSTVKEELSRQLTTARHCQIAEMAAILSLCGRVKISASDHFAIAIHTENLAVARKYFTLLKKTFNINTDVLIRQGLLPARSRTYVVAVREHEDALRVLQAAKLLDANGEIAEDLSLVHNVIVQNTCCRRAFIRGAFLAAGSISDPEKFYHFEITCASMGKAKQLQGLMASFGIDARIVLRKRYFVVYVKEGSQIVDLLNIMEAPVALMELENIRIVKEMRNTVNRKVNCETANINKTVSAAVKQMKWCWCIPNLLRCCPRCRPAARSCRCPLQRRNWKATARQIPLAQQNLIRPSGMSWPGSCPSLWAA